MAQRVPVRVEFSMTIIVMPLVVLVVMVVLTSGIQIFRVAQSNPVEHLKSE
jgi:hypothetical protein